MGLCLGWQHGTVFPVFPNEDFIAGTWDVKGMFVDQEDEGAHGSMPNINRVIMDLSIRLTK